MDKNRKKVLYLKDRLDKIGTSSSDSFIATGFNAIDDLIGGLERGCLSLWGKSRGMASKALLDTLLLQIAIKQNTPTAIFTLQESREEFLCKLCYMLSGHPMFKINSLLKSPFDFNKPIGNAEFSKSDLANVENAISLIENAPLVIEQETKYQYLKQLRSHVMGLMARKQIELVIIDDLDSITSAKPNEMNTISRHIKKDEELRFLQSMARENDLHVIVTSSLSKGISFRTEHAKRPALQDFYNIETPLKFADSVCTVYRPSYFKIPFWDVHHKRNRAIHTEDTLELGIVQKSFRTRELFSINPKFLRITDFNLD